MAGKKRVVVISKNADIAAFFELEAMSCGCPVRILPTPPHDLSPYDIAIADAETGYCLPDGSGCHVVTLLTENSMIEKPMTETVWTWPVSIRQIRALLEPVEDAASLEEKKGNREGEVPTLYIVSAEKRQLLYRNQTIELTDHAWRLLQCLGAYPLEVVSRDTLKESLGGVSGGNTVDVYIHTLRKKLESPFGIRLISSVRGQGYRLEAHLRHVKK